MKKEKYIVLVGDEITTAKFNELDTKGYTLLSASENRAVFILKDELDGNVYRSLQEDAVSSIINQNAPTGKAINKAIDVGVQRLKAIKSTKGKK